MTLRNILPVLTLASAVWPSAVRAATLRPVAVDRFFVAPDETVTLEWTVTSGTPQDPMTLHVTKARRADEGDIRPAPA